MGLRAVSPAALHACQAAAWRWLNSPVTAMPCSLALGSGVLQPLGPACGWGSRVPCGARPSAGPCLARPSGCSADRGASCTGATCWGVGAQLHTLLQLPLLCPVCRLGFSRPGRWVHPGTRAAPGQPVLPSQSPRRWGGPSPAPKGPSVFLVSQPRGRSLLSRLTLLFPLHFPFLDLCLTWFVKAQPEAECHVDAASLPFRGLPGLVRASAQAGLSAFPRESGRPRFAAQLSGMEVA